LAIVDETGVVVTAAVIGTADVVDDAVVVVVGPVVDDGFGYAMAARLAAAAGCALVSVAALF